MSAVALFGSQPRGMGLALRAPLACGDAGIEQTIGVMRQLIDEALADPDFVNTAVRVVSSAPAHDEIGELEAIYSYVAQNVRFTKDPVTKEKLYPPQELLKIGAGDCDDISMLTAALLMAVGYPARLVTVAASGGAPGEFSHVYCEAEVPPGSGNWIPLDSARPDSAFGLAPAHYSRKRAWSLTDSSYSDLSGERTKLFGLGGYVGMGDWCDVACTIASEVPLFIAAGTGAQYAQSPSGAVSYNPKSTLGPGYSLGSSSSLMPLLLLGVVAFLVIPR